MAAEIPRLPRIVGLPLAAWWFLHFAAGIVIVETTELWLPESFLCDEATIRYLVPLFAVSYHFAANIYLAMATAAVSGSSLMVDRIWRHRFAIDGVFILPLLLRSFLA